MQFSFLFLLSGLLSILIQNAQLRPYGDATNLQTLGKRIRPQDEMVVKEQQKDLAIKLLKWLLNLIKENQKFENLVVVVEILLELYQPLRGIYQEFKRQKLDENESSRVEMDEKGLKIVDDLVKMVNNGGIALRNDHLKAAVNAYIKKEPQEVKEFVSLLKEHVGTNFNNFYLPKSVEILKTILTGIFPYLHEFGKNIRQNSHFLWEMDDEEQEIRFGQQFI